jgi:hypothetical protein
VNDLGIAHLVDRDSQGHFNPTAPLLQITTVSEDSFGLPLLPQLLDSPVVQSLSPSEVSLTLRYFRAIVLPQDPFNPCQSTLLRLIPKSRCTSRGGIDASNFVIRQMRMVLIGLDSCHITASKMSHAATVET